MTLTLPANPCFREVDRCQKRYVVLMGSAGSGKSVDTAQHYLLRLMQDKGRNLLCVRKSDITNRDSTFAELTGALYRMFGDKAGRYWQVNLSPMSLVCRHNGNTIIFRGVNDERQREKLKSITFQRGKLTDVWIEEATEITQSDFEIIDDRLRGELPPGQFYQIRLTFNPVNKNHWIKKVFFDTPDPNVLTHHSTYLENRFIDDAYRQRMERRKRVDPEGYRIYGLGEWGETGGLILKSWEIKECSQSLEDYDDVAIGQDFGFNHANAVLLLGWKDGDVYILRELYVFEKDTAEIIRLNPVSLPRLAEGGVLERGQVGLLEGSGAEAVVPLEQNTGWIRRVAEQLNRYGSRDSQSQPQPQQAPSFPSPDQTEVTRRLGGLESQVNAILNLLQTFFPQLLDALDVTLVLHDGTLVAKLAPKLDKRLAVLAKRKEAAYG